MRKNSIWTKLLALMLALTLVTGVLAGCSQSEEDEEEIIQAPEDPVEYMQFVEERGVSSLSSSISNVYGQLTDTITGKGNGKTNGMEVKAELTLGDKVLGSLKSELAAGGYDMDASFLRKISLTVGSAQEKGISGAELKLGLGGTHIISANMMMDQSSGVMYFALPEVSDRYLKVDMYANMGQAGLANGAYEQYEEMMASLAEALPSAETVTALLEKYLELALDQIQAVDKTTETMTVNGVSQELTALTMTITEQDALNIAKKLMQTAKDDPQLLAILENLDGKLGELAAELGGGYESGLAADYQQEIDAMMAELEQVIVSEDGANLEIKTYTNGKHQVVGRCIAIGDEELFKYLFVESNTAFAMEAYAEAFVVTGNGTISNGNYNGKFTLAETDSGEKGTIELRNYNPAKNKNGKTDLEIRLIPETTMPEEFYAMGYTGQASLGLRVVDNSITISMLSDEETIVAMQLSAQAKNYDLSVPSNAIDASNQTELLTWLYTIKTDKVMDNLKKAGVPMEMVEQLLYGVMY